MEKKKLIEVALPLEAINAASSREKSIRHGHPSTLHLWWARRPLAAARAVVWASLVDDPSAHPEQFPTEEAQNAERQRLFKILEDLVVWENSNNEKVLSAAKAEIMKSTDNNPPALLDPFAGGGAIPLEAQRLGLEAHAHDLNPVAVMINKAMIEIPPRFANLAPVNPNVQTSVMKELWVGARGLANDVQYYGKWLKNEAFSRIGHNYPEISIPHNREGKKATVIAWIWSRTVKCPNPACGQMTPLMRSFTLSRRKGHEAAAIPRYSNGQLTFEVTSKKISTREDGTVNRKGARCACCGTPIDFAYIRNEGKANRLTPKLVAVVAESGNGRLYLQPDEEQIVAANVEKPNYYPDAELPYNPRNFQTPNYGMKTVASLFTNRQLSALITFSGLICATQDKAESDAISMGMRQDYVSLVDGGSGARAYGEAIGIYLSFIISKLADRGSSICSWDASREGLRNTFGRQAIPMTWDFAEANPFSNSSGCFDNCSEWIEKCLNEFPCGQNSEATQFDAQSDCGLRNIMVSTDPPYYNNIVYADLADYFYVWMRQSLKKTYPELFRTMLVPKAEELVATPYRFEGNSGTAKEFFEDGMSKTCEQIWKYSRDDIPVTIYYAYKQNDMDDDEGEAQTGNSGWETMLSAIINAGFSITGTWPMRTEMANRTVASATNALASSIVLACRKRNAEATVCTRRNFISELKRELKISLRKLQYSNIAPVDLSQSAIGPGMGVFSKYKNVLEADGSPMTVRSALQIINQELDLFFNEQDGELDRDSRFCVELYTQNAFNDIKFGDADTLARAKNTSVAIMASKGVLYAQKGVVHLLAREELPTAIHSDENMIWLLTQQLTYAMEKGGIEACAKIIAPMYGSNAEHAKSLAYRLYTIAERKGWAQEAYAYNSLVVAWPDIQSRAAQIQAIEPEQMTIFDYAEEVGAGGNHDGK